MTILFDVLLRVARALDEDVWEGTATGGGATTLVDAAANLEDDDFWNGGTLFFKTGNRANTIATITDFTKTSGTFTFATGLACATGNEYLALTPAWSKARLIQAVNTALQQQVIVKEDETTAAVSGQTVYTLPAGVSNLCRVEYGSDSDGWSRSLTWREAGGEVRFFQSEPGSGTIRLHYYGKPATAGTESATITAGTDIDLLVWDALVELHLQRSQRSDENPREQNRMTYYKGEAERRRKTKHIRGIDARMPEGW